MAKVYTLDEQIKEIEEELKMRLKVYKGQILSRKMTKKEANTKYMTMQAALNTLQNLKKERVGEQVSLFDKN